MRLMLMSDLHIEQKWDGPEVDILSCRPDVLVLAGDIHNGDCVLEWIVKRFLEPWPELHVIFVEGNHEFYGNYLVDLPKNLLGKIQSASMKRLHYLHKSQVILQGVRFLGTTLWTDFRLFDDNPVWAMKKAETYMADYRKISRSSNQHELIDSQDIFKENSDQFNWLKQNLHQPFKGKTVVVTHHAPSIQSIDTFFKKDELTPAYASNYEEVAEHADYWLHGHIHSSVDYLLGRCRVISNPTGYPENHSCENKQFNPGLIIDI